LPLPTLLDHFHGTDAIASFVSIKPNLSYHVVAPEPGGLVTGIQEMRSTATRINGGFFALRNEIFDHLHEGEELVVEPFQRLVARRRLAAYEYDGFWMSMDTFKDRQQLEEIYASGRAPWQVWNDAKPEAQRLAAIGA
jgi:glucose-1-phosphate cytidylyltransferase